MENNKKVFIILICVFLIILCGGAYLYFKVPNMGYRTEVPTEKTVKDIMKSSAFPKDDYDVVLKDNLESSGKTEIYLKDKDAGTEKLLISLSRVKRDTFNPVGFYKGNIYLIIRNITEEDWSDDLWRYDLSGKGEKIYSGKGLNFVISKTENKIVLNKDVSESDSKAIVIMDLNGKVLKGFEKSEISVYSEFSDELKKNIKEDEITFNILNVTDKFVTIKNSKLAWAAGVTKINLETMTAEKNSFSDLEIVGEDYNFNPSMNKVVFSTYPVMPDIQSAKEFAKNKDNKIYFYYYDLESKNKISLGTSIGKRFYPIWIDDNNFRYADPTEVIPEFGSITKWITKNISEVGQ